MLKTPHRRLKVIIKTILVMIVLFLATILICSVVYLLHLSKGIRILSPVTDQAFHRQATDKDINRIKSFCLEHHLSCQSITKINDGTIEVKEDTDSVVLFSAKKDIDIQLASLQSIITQLTIKGKQFRKLDFRFDTVVVSF